VDVRPGPPDHALILSGSAFQLGGEALGDGQVVGDHLLDWLFPLRLRLLGAEARIASLLSGALAQTFSDLPGLNAIFLAWMSSGLATWSMLFVTVASTLTCSAPA